MLKLLGFLGCCHRGSAGFAGGTAQPEAGAPHPVGPCATPKLQQGEEEGRCGADSRSIHPRGIANLLSVHAGAAAGREGS